MSIGSLRMSIGCALNGTARAYCRGTVAALSRRGGKDRGHNSHRSSGARAVGRAAGLAVQRQLGIRTERRCRSHPAHSRGLDPRRQTLMTGLAREDLAASPGGGSSRARHRHARAPYRGGMSMSRTIYALSIAALAWMGAPAVQADSIGQQARMRFESMDRNGDGVISRSEWQGSERSFIVHDWNGDGLLSGEEVRIGGRRTNVQEADHMPNRYEQNLNWTEQNFNALDHNRDGRLTRNEWHWDTETFGRVDTNDDNAISRAEFLATDDDDRG